MNFQFDLKTSVEESVKGIASQVIESTVSDCSSKELNDHEKIHLVRKKCKRIRALLRIVRSSIGETYKSENIFYRDLGRKLSEARDIQVFIETLNKMSAIPINSNISEIIQSLVNYFIEKRDAINSNQLLFDFKEEILKSKSSVVKWEICNKGFQCLNGGLKKTYRRGRIAMKDALENPSMERYHEWRKRAKYHYHHLELLVPVWVNIMKQFTEEAHRLSEMLGSDHDLGLLKERIQTDVELNIHEEVKSQMISSIEKEQQELREKIFLLGKKVYAEKPDYLVTRIEHYWNYSDKDNN